MVQVCEEYFDFDKRIEGFGELDYEEFINLKNMKDKIIIDTKVVILPILIRGNLPKTFKTN